VWLLLLLEHLLSATVASGASAKKVLVAIDGNLWAGGHGATVRQAPEQAPRLVAGLVLRVLRELVEERLEHATTRGGGGLLVPFRLRCDPVV
jgi:hypothetical protein